MPSSGAVMVLTYSPNRGFAVLQFGPEDRAQIDEVRLMLETRALERARERATPADLDTLAALKAELLARGADEGALSARDEMEMRFHTAIWSLSGNSWLAISLKQIMGPYFILSRPFGLRRPDLTPELFAAHHQAYLDFLSGNSSQSAEDCVRFHLGLPAKDSRK